MKKLLPRLKQAVPAIIYMVIYLIWFYLIENMKGRDYTIIHMKADDKIPFCELFITIYHSLFILVLLHCMDFDLSFV